MGFRAKDMMNVARYMASGKIHKNGADTRSVVIKVVTPNIRLEGTKDNPTHHAFEANGVAGAKSIEDRAGSGFLKLLMLYAHTAVMAISPAYPANQACV